MFCCLKTHKIIWKHKTKALQGVPKVMQEKNFNSELLITLILSFFNYLDSVDL